MNNYADNSRLWRTDEVDGHEVLVAQSATGVEWTVVQPVEKHERAMLDDEWAFITAYVSAPLRLVALPVSDWNTQLSPWEAPAVFNRSDFGSGAADTLQFIISHVLPLYESRRCCLAGYSLAGLFALYGGYNSCCFDAVVAASPSVWFPHWTEYASGRDMQAQSVYLSIGDTESRSKNPLLRGVAGQLQQQYEMLTCYKTLQLNPGNHFMEVAKRVAKGVAWVIGGR